MRLSSKTLSALISLLLGVAWAVAFLGPLFAIYNYYIFGFLAALSNALIWALPGIFMIVVLEYILVGFKRYEELKKQTRLLEEIKRELKNIK